MGSSFPRGAAPWQGFEPQPETPPHVLDGLRQRAAVVVEGFQQPPNACACACACVCVCVCVCVCGARLATYTTCCVA